MGRPKKGAAPAAPVAPAKTVTDAGGIYPSAEIWQVMRQEAETFMASTFLPAKYNTLEKVLTVMLKGRELGIPPLQALEGIFVSDEGRLALQADVMRSLILRSGIGMMEPLEVTNDHATVQGTRFGRFGRPAIVKQVTFSLEDAARAGLGGDTWRKYPRPLCFARATSEMARMLFSDVLAGMVYTPEELGDRSSVPVSAPAPAEVALPPGPPPSVGADDSVERRSTPAADEAPAPFAVQRGRGVSETCETHGPEKSESGATPAPASPESGVPLTHSFKVEALGGGVRVIRTAGITRDLLRVVGDMTTARAGRPDWQVLQVRGRRWLLEHGIDDLIYLTKAQGLELIAHLEAPPERVVPAAVDSLDATLDEMGLLDEKENIVRLICRSYGVETLDRLKPEVLRKAVGEIGVAAQDRQVLALMLERAQVEVG
jgi:hypothetical protein